MIKYILFVCIVIAGLSSHGQMNGDWYTVRGTDLVYISVTPKYFVTGQIRNYGGTREYKSRVDTSTIQRHTAHDSVVLITVFSSPDRMADPARVLQTQKFIYHATDHSLTAVPDTLTNRGLVRFYPKESIDIFMRYKKIVDEPGDTLVALFNTITAEYNRIKSSDPKTKMQYASLGPLLTTAIETPVFLLFRICPLLRRDHMDEDAIKEKFINDNAVLVALDRLEKARLLQ